MNSWTKSADSDEIPQMAFLSGYALYTVCYDKNNHLKNRLPLKNRQNKS